MTTSSLSRLRSRRAALGGIAALAVLVPAGSAAAYSPGGQGQIGVSAFYTMNESTYDHIPGDSPGDRDVSDTKRVNGSASAVANGPGFGAQIPPMPPPNTACTGGCADASSIVASRVSAAGVLETYGSAWAWAFGEGQEALGGGRSEANIDDTLTVSKDTVVTLRGRIQGTLRRQRDHSDQQEPRAEMSLDIGLKWCGSEGCDLAVSKSYEPELAQTLDVDETFEVQVPLEGGTHPFNAELKSVVDALGNGVFATNGGGDGSSARADGHAGDGDVHKVTFEIVVPNDVVAESGSGLLPIVGGKQPEQDDTTPPTLSVPSDVTADATSPAGRVVSWQTQATDDSGKAPTVTCDPESGSTFAIGQRKVVCVAADEAGNQTTKSFTVTILGVDDLIELLRQRIGETPRRAQQNLLQHARPRCNSMDRLMDEALHLNRKSILPLTDFEDLKALVERIERQLSC